MDAFCAIEKGYEFPVTSDRFGRSHIFNSVPLDVVHAMAEILDAGVGAVRVDLTTETAARGTGGHRPRAGCRRRGSCRASRAQPAP